MVDEVDGARAFPALDQCELVEVEPVRAPELGCGQAVAHIRQGEDLQPPARSGRVAVPPLDHRQLSHFDHHVARLYLAPTIGRS